jgi:ribulose-5-phosphate 4-epimerase/fuculose-1-phosphate aldolase
VTGTQPSVELCDELVTANRILFHQSIVDGFGHISARNDADPSTFVMARYVAPGLVTTEDMRVFTLDSAAVREGERHYSERFIHGEIYKARPDVTAVIHCHAAPLLPFGVTKTPLRPIYHMSAFLAAGVPVFEIREAAGMTDMLIRTADLGAALARTLGDRPMALMRGHGATFVGDSIKQVVYRAIYATQNAVSQMDALRLGEVTYLEPEEAEKMESHARDILNRPWEIWKRQALGQD